MYDRAIGVKLAQIKACLDPPSFDRLAALHSHLTKLQTEKVRLEQLIRLVEQTIQHEERKALMRNEEKFTAFKQQIVAENEAAFGKEAREQYGNDSVDESQAAVLGLAQEQYQTWSDLDTEIQARLEQAVQTEQSPESQAGKTICDLHRRWLTVTNKRYSPAQHRGVAALYVEDERFTAYYDKHIPGCARFLRDAVLFWVK